MANSLCLLRGLPVPRHSEGGFVSALLASVGSSRWVAHFEDLLQQRWWYAKLFYQYENLAGGPDDIEVYYQDAAASAATDGSYTNQALAWLKQANRVRDVLLQGKAEAAARYARRNLLVMLTLTIMIAVLSGCVLHAPEPRP